ncbi:MAG: carboxypeptidase-like regulatory domain-containing protein [Planctomycetota bacterium]
MQLRARFHAGILLALTAGLAGQSASSQLGPTSLRGRVCDERGQPLAGVGVVVVSDGTPRTECAWAEGTVRTDARGHFEVAWQRDAEGAAAEPAHAGVQVLIATPGRVAAVVVPDALWVRRSWQGVADPRLSVDVVLPPAVELRGRVRDVDGQPIAGALVTASDACASLPASVLDAFVDTTSEVAYRSATRTGADGRFVLPGVFASGSVVTVRADGFYERTLRPVSRATPLALDLQRSGYCAGRVVDADGQPCRALVVFHFETLASPLVVTTGADGAFRQSLPVVGRYRARASATDGVASGESPLLSAPADDLILRVVASDPAFVVRIVAKDGGAPIDGARAGVVWFGEGEGSFTEYLADTIQPTADARAGVVRLAAPGPRDQTMGIVVVTAPGFARCTMKRVAWNPERPELRVELEPEATVAGVVRGADGEPLAGACVRLSLQRPQPDGVVFAGASLLAAVTAVTDAAGTFAVGGLAAGTYELVALVPDRPATPRREVRLVVGQHEGEVALVVPRGVSLRGELSHPPGDCAFRLELTDRTAMGFQGLVLPDGGDAGTPLRTTAPGPDGGFVLRGLAPGRRKLELAARYSLRGGPVRLALADVRVRGDDLELEFDAARQPASEVHGRVTCTGAVLPSDSLMVVARPVEALEMVIQGWGSAVREAVGADGAFALRVAPGKYRFEVVDLTSGVVLNPDADVVEVGAAGASRAIELTLGRVRVHLRSPAGTEVAVSHVELRLRQQAAGAFAVPWDDSSYDSGVGVVLQPGQTTVDLVAPAGDLRLSARSHVAGLFPAGTEPTDPRPLGAIEIAVKSDRVVECDLELTPLNIPTGK